MLTKRETATLFNFLRVDKGALSRLMLDAYELASAVATWKERDDGMVYSDEPLTSYLLKAREIVKRVEGV